MCAAPGSKTFQLLEMLHEGSSHGQAPAGACLWGGRAGSAARVGGWGNSCWVPSTLAERAQPREAENDKRRPTMLAAAATAGIVVANDADGQRCNLLTHQTKRMCSPCLMITNHGGEMFPRMFDPSAAAGKAEDGEAEGDAEAEGEDGGDGGGAAGGKRKRAKQPRLLFDRILADVPCSGEWRGCVRRSDWAKHTPHTSSLGAAGVQRGMAP